MDKPCGDKFCYTCKGDGERPHIDYHPNNKAEIKECKICGHRGYRAFDKAGDVMAAYLPTNEDDFGLIVVASYMAGAEGVEIGVNDGIVPYRTTLVVANRNNVLGMQKHEGGTMEEAVNWWVEVAWNEAMKMVKESRDINVYFSGISRHGEH